MLQSYQIVVVVTKSAVWTKVPLGKRCGFCNKPTNCLIHGQFVSTLGSLRIQTEHRIDLVHSMGWHRGSLLHELGLVVSHALQPHSLVVIVHHLGRHQMRVHARWKITAASKWIERYVLVLLLLILLDVLLGVLLCLMMVVSLTLIGHISYADWWVTDSLTIVRFRVAAGSLVLRLGDKLGPVWIDHFLVWILLVFIRLLMSYGQRLVRSSNVWAPL